jgi:hypothetical protein
MYPTVFLHFQELQLLIAKRALLLEIIDTEEPAHHNNY